MIHDPYLESLRAQVAARREQRRSAEAAKVTDPLADLKARIDRWHKGLPPEMRVPYYHMNDLAQKLKAPPQQLGLALDALGWTRRRQWITGRPYRNRWFPPDEVIETSSTQQQ